jgi:hypothetical protein
VLRMITKGRPSINLVERFSGMCEVMLFLLGCAPWGILGGINRRGPCVSTFAHKSTRLNVSHGSNSEVARYEAHVRSTLKSRHRQATPACPKGAITRSALRPSVHLSSFKPR